ncbi:MAG TPA: type I restriction enzyme HsdR N-terminal domain-containing protein, partial [Gaiellaceae bacterium]|nr:type I restriction enzyme HsdR N-terminal domain-containing protein [Gaiellaceae bacterium]
MQTFLRNVGEVFGRDVEARTEALTGGGVRPDLGVSVDGLLVGHVELKAPGKGARPQTFADRHDREQFKRLADHPNLVYTDGNEWALYRLGTRIGDVVSSRGDVLTDAYDAYDRFGAGALALLLGDFLSWQPLVPSSPRALAELLAPLTRLLRTNVV